MKYLIERRDRNPFINFHRCLSYSNPFLLPVTSHRISDLYFFLTKTLVLLTMYNWTSSFIRIFPTLTSKLSLTETNASTWSERSLRDVFFHSRLLGLFSSPWIKGESISFHLYRAYLSRMTRRTTSVRIVKLFSLSLSLPRKTASFSTGLTNGELCQPLASPV